MQLLQAIEVSSCSYLAYTAVHVIDDVMLSVAALLLFAITK